MKTTTILLLALILAPLSAGAAVYKYVDENGVTRYTDRPPVNAPASTLDIRPGRQVTPSATSDQAEQGTLERMRESDQRAAESERRLQEAEEARLRAERERSEREANRKFSGCDLAGQLKNVSKGKAMSQKLVDSADGLNFSQWRQPGGWVGTRILSFDPVCGNQTRYTMTINDANYVWELRRDIVR